MNKKLLISIVCLISFQIVHPLFAAEKIKIIWVDKDNNCLVNEEYIKSAPDQIKAILAYYSLMGGVSCWWEGDKPNRDYDNISCGLTKALGLGYQCGQTQLGFVNKWFKGRGFTKDGCNSRLETSTYTTCFPSLEIEIKGDIISARYNRSFCNTGSGDTLSYWGRDIFKTYPDKVLILQRLRFKESLSNFWDD